MNTPEKIVQTYLRLNGFFTLFHFSVLEEKGTHADLLAIRPGESIEAVGPEDYKVPLNIDNSFLKQLGVTPKDPIGLVVEVKSGDEKAGVTSRVFDYVKPFFGKTPNLRKVGFDEKVSKISCLGDHIVVPLKYCLDFIIKRFEELDRIDKKLKGSGRLSKRGSWHLSEEFLSDLLFLHRQNPESRE